MFPEPGDGGFPVETGVCHCQPGLNSCIEEQFYRIQSDSIYHCHGLGYWATKVPPEVDSRFGIHSTAFPGQERQQIERELCIQLL